MCEYALIRRGADVDVAPGLEHSIRALVHLCVDVLQGYRDCEESAGLALICLSLGGNVLNCHCAACVEVYVSRSFKIGAGDVYRDIIDDHVDRDRYRQLA